MGLDMYLRGKKHIPAPKTPVRVIEEKTGCETEEWEDVLELGYWRKHPNLHGYFVQTFGGGEDECQEMFLGVKELEQTIKAIKAESLPTTGGFFFGESDGTEKAEDLKILKAALAWVKEDPENRKAVYQASW